MTGKQKIIDTAGRVDRFKKKYAAQEAAKEAAKEETAKK
jgi:large subunit ribosomal protein L31